MNRLILIAIAFLSVLSGCTFLKVNIIDEVQPLAEKTISGRGRDKILVLDISGIIMTGEKGYPLSDRRKPGLIARVREALDKARQDKAVKAVVLRINSPGGGVTASDILYHELMKFKQETGVVMVAHIMDVGASGGYYIAMAADAVTAQPTSITGSIGVIMYRVDITGLMDKIGIRTAEIASGDKKGQGSPFRRLTDEESKMFQNFIDKLHGRFVALVSESRKLPLDAVKKAADGRVLNSDEAKTLGLIDGIGYLDDAVELAVKKANLSQATVVMYHRPGEFRTNIYSLNLFNFDLGEFAETGASFLYLWWP